LEGGSGSRKGGNDTNSAVRGSLALRLNTQLQGKHGREKKKSDGEKKKKKKLTASSNREWGAGKE